MSERQSVVLANSTPLISLARHGLFHLLQVLYGRIILPPAVYREVVIEGRGRPGAQESEEAIAAGWIEVSPLQAPEAARRIQTAFLLGDGESEVLALAQEQSAALVLIDEAQGFRRAEELGIPALRTIGILLQAKASGLIPTVKEPLDALRTEGFRLSDDAYREALQKAGEETTS
jgi:predicted nucleic acid-binding protein